MSWLISWFKFLQKSADATCKNSNHAIRIQRRCIRNRCSYSKGNIRIGNDNISNFKQTNKMSDIMEKLKPIEDSRL